MLATIARRLFGWSVGLILLAQVTEIRAQGFSPYREYEPIVVSGSAFGDWVGAVDETRITLHVYSNGTWVPVPFQVDKRRTIHTNYNVNPSDASYLATNCELGYFQELRTGPNNAPQADFSSNTLQSTDEFAFLLHDILSNTSRASTAAWISDSTVSNTRVEIKVLDPRTGDARYVYAYFWPGAPPAGQIDTTDYIGYQSDNDQQCQPTVDACGAVRSNQSSRLSDLATLDTHFGGNWITDALQIRNTGNDASAESDLLDRIRYYADGEDEGQWSTGGSPEFLGLTNGRIRVIRGVEGAKSGRQTTKYEVVYPTLFVTRVNLRVHNLLHLHVDFDHENTIATIDASLPGTTAYVWSGVPSDPPVVPNADLDRIDGICVLQGGTCHPLQFGVGDWVQVSSPIRGAYFEVFNEARPLPVQSASDRAVDYTDMTSQTGGNSLIADYTRKWSNIACTDDSLAGNTFSCDDPEADSLWFARLETAVVPNPNQALPLASGSVAAHIVADNILLNPLQTSSLQESRDVPPPTPSNPCTPTLSAGTDPHTGAARMQIGPTMPCGGTIGVKIYRSEGSDPFIPVKTLGTAPAWTDYATLGGRSYSYRAVAVNAAGVLSSPSNTLTITPVDTAAPPAPAGLQGSVSGTIATLDPTLPCSRDLAGLNFYSSSVSGGPYTKLNSSPVSVAVQPMSWTRAGLAPNHVYYFVTTSVDFSGNESGYSPELMLQTGSN